MAKSLKNYTKTDTKTAKRAAEKTATSVGAHQLAKVPDKSIAESYVHRKFQSLSDFDVFKLAHKEKMNVLIEGPTGPGKTTAAMAYAAENDHAFYAVPSNVGVEPSQLFGKFIPDGSGGFIWQDGPVTDLVRHGGVLLINEVNFMPPRVATVLFGLLDKRRQITLLDHKAEVIDAHDNLLIIADMNPDYAGTQKLNAAFRNRFPIQLFWDYDEKVEKKLIKSGSLRQVAKRLRELYREEKLVTPTATNMLQEFERLAVVDYQFAVEVFTQHYLPDERSGVNLVFNNVGDAIMAELDPAFEPIVFTDSDGNDWTQSALDQLRSENVDNPDYVDPEYGVYGVDFTWGDEDDDDNEEETEDAYLIQA